MIPQHQRDNYERTDELLHEARVLLTAIESADDEAPPRDNLDRFAQAVPALIGMLGEKLDQIEKARAAEWVGLGGNWGKLSESETEMVRALSRVNKPSV